MAGGIFSAANPSYTARELAHQLKDSGASYLFVMEASLGTAVEAATIVGLPLDRVRLFDQDVLFKGGEVAKKEKDGVQSWGSVFASEEEGRKYKWADLKGRSCQLIAPRLPITDKHQVPMKQKKLS